MSSSTEQAKLGPPDFGKILTKAFTGGIAGAGAMVVQVTSLMWMRTTMNYQVNSIKDADMRNISPLRADCSTDTAVLWYKP